MSSRLLKSKEVRMKRLYRISLKKVFSSWEDGLKTFIVTMAGFENTSEIQLCGDKWKPIQGCDWGREICAECEREHPIG